MDPWLHRLRRTGEGLEDALPEDLSENLSEELLAEDADEDGRVASETAGS